jgi:serine protease Do
MAFSRGSRRSLAVVVAAAVALTLAALGPGRALTKETSAPIWTERPVAVTPSMVQAPNWVELARVLKPAVVNINTKRMESARPGPQPNSGNDPLEPFYRHFFGDAPSRPVRSLGSGFVINAGGYVVTNNHVVDNATEIRVKLSDGRELSARIAGRDPKTDLALLKIEATGLPAIPLGDSSALQVGEPVMAIGNPFGLEQTVTTGIVSATGRVIGEGAYDDFIQTDASINPGNSGGPLINAQGQAVGINTAIVSRSGGSVGIGFAIPIKLAKPIIAQLAATGHVVRSWLGVTIQPVTADLAKTFHLSEATGALVSSVAEGSPAMKAGVKPGDVIVEYNGEKVARSQGLPRVVADTPAGRDVAVKVIREGKPLTLTVRVAPLAEEEAQATTTPKKNAALGLAVSPLTPEVARELRVKEPHGVVVRGVEDASPAAEAGMQPGDVILEVDHHAVKNVDDLKQALDRHPAGTPVLVLVHRQGESFYAAVTS